MWKIKLALSLILISLVGIFVIQNTEILNVEFLTFSFQMRRFVLIFLVLLIGFFAGWTFRSQFVDKADLDRETSATDSNKLEV